MRKLLRFTGVIMALLASANGFGQVIKPQTTDKLIIKAGCPDLIVQQLKVTKLTPTTIAYRYVIKNIGKVPASLEGKTNAHHDNVSVQAFLSKDNKYSKDDLAAGGTIITRSPAGRLRSGQTKTGQFQASLKKHSKNYRFLILLVDWKKSLKECNERNNVKAIRLRPAKPKCPDLIVQRLKVTKLTANAIAYNYVIKNIGKSTASLEGKTHAHHDNVSVQAFLSKDNKYSKDDLAAGGTIITRSPAGGLRPNETKTGQFRASLKKHPRNYRFLILLVDWGKALKECNERNNAKAIPLKTVKPKCPDLIVRRLNVVSKTHNSIKYQYVIQNIGTKKVAIKGVAAQAYLSSNRTKDRFDVPAGGRVLSTKATDFLAPGQSISQSFQATTKENPNQYPFLILVIDNHKTVKECREDNNIGVDTIR